MEGKKYKLVHDPKGGPPMIRAEDEDVGTNPLRGGPIHGVHTNCA